MQLHYVFIVKCAENVYELITNIQDSGLFSESAYCISLHETKIIPIIIINMQAQALGLAMDIRSSGLRCGRPQLSHAHTTNYITALRSFEWNALTRAHSSLCHCSPQLHQWLEILLHWTFTEVQWKTKIYVNTHKHHPQPPINIRNQVDFNELLLILYDFFYTHIDVHMVIMSLIVHDKLCVWWGNVIESDCRSVSLSWGITSTHFVFPVSCNDFLLVFCIFWCYCDPKHTLKWSAISWVGKL